MKTIIVLFLFTLISLTGISQDVIVKRNGEKIQSKVIEITSTTIKYKKFEQEEGPLRNINISEVAEIIYDNGDWEKFKEEEIKEEQVIITSRPRRLSRSGRDPLFDNGMYLDLMFGYTDVSRVNTYTNEIWYDEFGNLLPEPIIQVTQNNQVYATPSMNFRIGHKWYFGQNERYRPGLQVQWMKFGIHVNPSQGYGSYSLSPLNVGITNALKFNDRHGMEFNLTGGFSMLNFNPFVSFGSGDFEGETGYTIGTELKYRFNILAVGLNYSRINAGFNLDNNRHNLNVISLSAGIKF
ncbi:MAG: hypothetical protein MK105_10925 [Crocinitomicaceae bacterium]|nr:hypothetical protein [Crocinitomicaceae bacterium]